MWKYVRPSYSRLWSTLVCTGSLLTLVGCGNVASELKDISAPSLDLTSALINSGDVTVIPGYADGLTQTIVAVRLTNASGTPLVGCSPTLTTGVGGDTINCSASNSSGVSTCTIYTLIAGLRNSTFTACSGSISIAVNIPAAPSPMAFGIAAGGPCNDCAGGAAGSASVSGTSGPTTIQVRPTIGAIFSSNPNGLATDQTTAKDGCYAMADGTTPCTPGNSGGGSFQLFTGIRGVVLDIFGGTTD